MDVKTMKKERETLIDKINVIDCTLDTIRDAMNTLEDCKIICPKMDMDKPQNNYEEAFVHLWHAFLRLSE